MPGEKSPSPATAATSLPGRERSASIVPAERAFPLDRLCVDPQPAANAAAATAATTQNRTLRV
jgi:hypothetical protein